MSEYIDRLRTYCVSGRATIPGDTKSEAVARNDALRFSIGPAHPSDPPKVAATFSVATREQHVASGHFTPENLTTFIDALDTEVTHSTDVTGEHYAVDTDCATSQTGTFTMIFDPFSATQATGLELKYGVTNLEGVTLELVEPQLNELDPILRGLTAVDSGIPAPLPATHYYVGPTGKKADSPGSVR